MNTTETTYVIEQEHISQELMKLVEQLTGEVPTRLAVFPVGKKHPFLFTRSYPFTPSYYKIASLTDGRLVLIALRKDADFVYDDDIIDAALPAETFNAVISENPVLTVWTWGNAPMKEKWSAGNGGDEDWVTFVPKNVTAPSWLDEGSAYGCCSVNITEYNGGTIHVGCHA